MINDVKAAITAKLNVVFPDCAVYDEYIQQYFKTPSFIVNIIEIDYQKRMSNKYDARFSFDVAYFTDKGKEETKADCLHVQILLFRAFDIVGAYRILDKNASITDDVLHFKFKVHASEIREEDFIKMLKQDTNTEIKE